jgi:ankyrin repeat protein
VNAKGLFGLTPLIWACQTGHVGIVKELHKHGADLEANNSIAKNPLYEACVHGRLPVVNELLR